ncbi:MAG TPA: hypothetical protein VKA27_15415, partial [Sunxiuqinia sp.]|nr:hypothetical protein [Sunxiuqinia sp.]
MKKGIISVLLFIFSVIAVFSQPMTIEQPIDAKYHLPLLGENVFVFDPAMGMDGIQALIDSLYALQTTRKSESSTNRYAFLFKPGTYKLDIKVGYYM